MNTGPRLWIAVLLLLCLAGCKSAPKQAPPPAGPGDYPGDFSMSLLVDTGEQRWVYHL